MFGPSPCPRSGGTHPGAEGGTYSPSRAFTDTQRACGLRGALLGDAAIITALILQRKVAESLRPGHPAMGPVSWRSHF